MILIFTPLLVLLLTGAFSDAQDPPVKEDAPPQSLQNAVSNYQDVLAVIPREMEAGQARRWTDAYKEVANSIIKKKLVDTKTPASLRLKVSGVAYWDQMCLWCEVPSDEGYSIRVFAGFRDDAAKPKLATLRPGDRIQLDGRLNHVVFEQLWNTPSLSICLDEAKFTKILAEGESLPALPPGELEIISAVYGSGTAYADVSARVASLLREPGAEFTAQPHWLGADPTPGWNKALVIVYRLNGARKVFTAGEGSPVSAALLWQPPVEK